MTHEQIKGMQEHNGRLMGAIKAIIGYLDIELDENPDNTPLRVCIEIGMAGLENRSVMEVKR